MDFFSHQDQARASTRKLVVLFCLAVLTLIVATSLLIWFVLFYMGAAGGQQGEPLVLDHRVLFSEIFLKVGLGVVAVVALGSLFRLAQLRGGGKVVAESMNGRLLSHDSADPDERKVLNVVEEMAIAAGLPVPPVYLIEDPAINAFAAGYEQEDAVIGVTRGCIRQLDRDQLQGVIAHEFSHILNGDMRLNIRLMGILYGIMVIGLIGYFLMRSGAWAAASRRQRNGGILILGLGLVVIGYGGTFFGNLIKAAVSRHREFLADASAVQFTRNPDGIAGALKKIGGYEAGSQLTRVNAAEISHMLFEEGRNAGFSGLFSTHPPLAERIRRLDPQWQGDAAAATAPRAAAAESAGGAAFAASGSNAGTTGADAGTSAFGEGPGPEQVRAAHAMLERLPASLREDLHSSLGACLAMFALPALRGGETQAQRQREILAAELRPADFTAWRRLYARLGALPATLHLPLLELALPALKQMSEAQARHFLSLMSKLVLADRRLSLFEWCLFMILRQHLAPAARVRGTRELGNLTPDCAVLLSLLAAAGHADEAERQAAFEAGRALLPGGERLRYQAGLDNDPAALEQALARLRELRPLHKPRLLKALVRCIHADGRVDAAERELLRAIGAVLDCPIPPLERSGAAC